jgi:hypothetical protein
MSRSATFVFVLVFANAVSSTVSAQPSPTTGESPLIRVELANGRTFTAALDARTTDERLWLRFDRQTAVLYRPVAWDDVSSAEYDGQTYSADELRQLAPQIRSERTQTSAANFAPRAPASTAAADAAEKTYAELALDALSASPRVQSIAIDAYLANWDADVEVDGIALSLAAIDCFGAPAAVDGTLNVELFAERRSRLKPPPLQHRENLERYGAWTKVLRAEYGGEPFFLLPFQVVAPDFDTAIGNYGLLHAKLAVPGQGVFEASVSDLRIRPISRNRDRLQDSSSQRFLPTEGTGRSKFTGNQP